ncbi:hypothetical protein JZ751_014569 [Albula glossodonta]|uniref:BTB domain-containing protein n=1 Tax=Albula glossodonta TaxID=121402 RepID=A0A8T2N221_9TELE|nr:hypothetical protein JZ751_014569 [Albula glossodonta]
MECRAKRSMALLDQLGRMREMDELTDVVLLAEEVRFPCHRVVLSAFSPYFRAMFTSGLRECHGREVALQDTSAESLGLIIDYMYGSELLLSNTNVQSVSITAFLLQIEEVFQLCQSHMIDNMDPSNCLGLYLYAQDLGAEGLARQAQRYLCQNFTEVCLNQEVLELEWHQLQALISSDDLNVSREESVLDVVLRWIDHRRGVGREVHAAELLQKVRLSLVDPAFLRQARRRNTALLCNSECFNMIDLALQSSCLAAASSTQRQLQLRYGMETTSLLLCIGGNVQSQRGSYTDHSFCYAPSTGRSYLITSPCSGEALSCVSAGVVTEDNGIMVAGEAGDHKGSTQRSRSVDIYRYEQSIQGSWTKLCSAEYRDMYALGALGETLYLLGGQMKLKNQYCITNLVEHWSLQGGAWHSSAPLPIPLACHSAVSLKNRLYSDRPDDEPDCLSNRVFQFDPSRNRWAERSRMRFSRYRCGTAVLNGEIYVLGGIGCDGADHGQSRHCLSSVEIYDPDGDLWREGPSLPLPQLSLRSNTSNAGVVEGKLYVCGSYRGADRQEAITKDILEFDPLLNQWTVAARRVLMHDSYDVCLVASLNPRDLLAPPTEE